MPQTFLKPVTKIQTEFMTKSQKTSERNLWVWTKQTTQKKDLW